MIVTRRCHEEGSNYGMLGRVIVHADLDCFYCQVEHVRLGIPKSTPLAVQQWDGLIAVNYEARKFGVKRGDRARVAKSKCPQLTLVHVETIDAESGACSGGNGGNGVNPAAADRDGAPDFRVRHQRGACKVSLERYRKASFAIMSIFQAHCRRVERASIDEAYLDITEEVAKICEEADGGRGSDIAHAPETDLQGTAGHRVDPRNAFDRALLAGARLTAAMRLAVERELGYTVSAGIASNKMLAKLASSRNKPNKQTVVPASAASEMLGTVPLRNVRGLGGKLGEEVASWSKVQTAKELQSFGQEKLVGKFGAKTGVWLWRICRGMDDEAVIPNLKPKSLSVCKTFPPISDRPGVTKWMHLLCKELAERIVEDRAAWNRRAAKLTLQIISLVPDGRPSARSGGDGKPSAITRSRTIDIPGGREPPSATALVSEAMVLFDKTESAMPCSRLALTAHEFGNLLLGRGSISAFLRADVPPEDAAPKSPRSTVKLKGLSSRGAHESSLTQVEGCDRSSLSSTDGFTAAEYPSTCVGFTREVQEACPQCGAMVSSGNLREHLDFHYAEELQKRYARESDLGREISARGESSSTGKRSQHVGGVQGGEGNIRGRGKEKSRRRNNDSSSSSRIDFFFKPA